MLAWLGSTWDPLDGSLQHPPSRKKALSGGVRGLGPFPDHAGKGRFAVGEQWGGRLVVVGVGWENEHTRRIFSVLCRADGGRLRLRGPYCRQCLFSGGSDWRRHAELVAALARRRYGVGRCPLNPARGHHPDQPCPGARLQPRVPSAFAHHPPITSFSRFSSIDGVSPRAHHSTARGE